MDWADLYQELERWRAMERAATLWWRDDDAADGTSALARLLGLATQESTEGLPPAGFKIGASNRSATHPIP